MVLASAAIKTMSCLLHLHPHLPKPLPSYRALSNCKLIGSSKMGLKGKLIAEVEVRSSGDIFHQMFASKPHHVSNLSSHVQACDLHDGELGKPGSTISWNYTLDGKACVMKQLVDIDEENKRVTYEAIDGDVLQEYKSFFIHLFITSEDGDMNLVKWVFEYEKLNDDVLHPTSLMAVALGVIEHIDDHHVKA